MQWPDDTDLFPTVQSDHRTDGLHGNMAASRCTWTKGHSTHNWSFAISAFVSYKMDANKERRYHDTVHVDMEEYWFFVK